MFGLGAGEREALALVGTRRSVETQPQQRPQNRRAGPHAAALRDLLGLPNVRVANPSRIALALEWYEHGLDFADVLHLASSQQAGSLKTFDRDFVKRSTGLGSCRVVSATSRV